MSNIFYDMEQPWALMYWSEATCRFTARFRNSNAFRSLLGIVGDEFDIAPGANMEDFTLMNQEMLPMDEQGAKFVLFRL